MRFSFAAAAAASLLATAQARIAGFTIPDTIKPGDIFPFIIRTENYIQSIADGSCSIGCDPGNGTPESLGRFVQTFLMGPENSNTLKNITFEATMPSTFPKGSALCTVACTSFWGALYMPLISNWNISDITIGDETSDDLVSSFNVY